MKCTYEKPEGCLMFDAGECREHEITGQTFCEFSKQLTNADHIRAMSDEELYVFLSGINFGECECPARDVCIETNSCANVFVDWLKQPKEDAK